MWDFVVDRASIMSFARRGARRRGRIAYFRKLKRGAYRAPLWHKAMGLAPLGDVHVASGGDLGEFEKRTAPCGR